MNLVIYNHIHGTPRDWKDDSSVQEMVSLNSYTFAVGIAMRRQGQQRRGAEGLHSVQPQVEPVERPQ